MSWVDNMFAEIDKGAGAAKNLASSWWAWGQATNGANPAQTNGAAGQPDMNQPVAQPQTPTNAVGQPTAAAGSMTHVIILGGAVLAGLMMMQKAG